MYRSAGWHELGVHRQLLPGPQPGVRERLGGLHSARVLLSSVDFAGIERLQHAGDWPATARLLAAEARPSRPVAPIFC